MSIKYKGTTFTASGVSSYNQLTNKPKINGVELTGDMSVGGNVTLNGASTTSPAMYAPTTSGTAGQILKSNGLNAAPTWQDATAATDPKVTLNGAEANVTPTGVNVYAPTSAGTAGQILKSKGANQAPVWEDATSGAQTSWYGTCATDGSIQIKEVTCEGFALVKGATLTVYFSNANTIATPQLNVNETGAKTVKCGNANQPANSSWWAASTCMFVYDGTYWQLLSISTPPCMYGACATAAGTVAKTVSIDGFQLHKGVVVYVSFSYPHISSTAATLNVNSTGAKTIKNWGNDVTTNNGTSWAANDFVALVYDGSYWRMMGSTNVAVGTIAMFGGDNIPAGWLYCNGGAFRRDTYAKLFAVISTKFGAGDGSTTFNVPDFRQRFPQGAGNGGLKGTQPALGAKTAPGVPDVYGQILVGGRKSDSTTQSKTGAFSGSAEPSKSDIHAFDSGSNGFTSVTLQMRASKGEVPTASSTSVENNVYGKSATVQPASTAVHFMIRWA